MSIVPRTAGMWMDDYNSGMDSKTLLLKYIPAEETELRTAIENISMDVEPIHMYEPVKQLENIVYKFIEPYEDKLHEPQYKWIDILENIIETISASRIERERDDEYDKAVEERYKMFR